MNSAKIVFEQPWGNFALKELIETPAPEQISWIPQTLGWQVLAITIFLLLLKKCYQFYKKYQSNAYRRDAIQWLEQLKKTATEQQLQQLPALLRKTAIGAFSRHDIVKLNGKQWDLWLDKQCDKTSFSQQHPNVLHQLAFAPNFSLPPEKLASLMQQISLWIKFHRRQDD